MFPMEWLGVEHRLYFPLKGNDIHQLSNVQSQQFVGKLLFSVVCADLVVGSPYDGPHGTGAVYIYHGSPDGIRPIAAQVCQAVTINSRLAAFGYSVSAGVDMDNNGYPGRSQNLFLLLSLCPFLSVNIRSVSK